MPRTSPLRAEPEVGIRPSWRWLTLVLLGAATIAAFFGVTRAGWILFDDPDYVVHNAHVSNGFTLDGIAWMFTHPHVGNFHPLTTLSHMLDCELFGLDPRGPHAVNLALHVANALLVCLVLAAYTGAWWRSALIAALFALHPLRVESVAWISERKDVLSGLFFWLTVWAYLRWTRSPTRGRQAWMIGMAALGLLSKPMLVTLPFVLLLLDWWPLDRLGRGGSFDWPTLRARVREKLALFAVSLIVCVTTWQAQRASGAVVAIEQLPLPVRLSNAALAIPRYLQSIAWPSDLAPYYPYDRGVPPIVPILWGAATVLVTIGALLVARKRPWLTVGWLWFLGMLAPVIGVVQVGGQSLADRYTYLPATGIAIALVFEVARLSRDSVLLNRAAAGLLSAALVASAYATQRQVALWRDTETLFAHTLRVTKGNPLAHQVFANVALEKGDIDSALEHFRKALELSPDYVEAHSGLGVALGMKGRYDEAIVEIRRALQARPTAEYHYNLGFALAQQGKFADAIGEFQAALSLEPAHLPSLIRLGNAFGSLGRQDEAAAVLEKALELAPKNVDALRFMAITQVLKGDVETAIRHYERLLQVDPRDLDALNNIAWIRATHADPSHRNGSVAVLLAERARDASPTPNATLFSTLAAAYAETGRFAEAVRAGERAVELARTEKDAAAEKSFESQLELYRVGRPFHP
ncbi:MAG: tetratricopeptide repeat protein [Planctomycetota bacterium]|nr:tetratricopeptide repeat protein [Planctomycetota bacterium]